MVNKSIELENQLMIESLISLRRLGGSGTRKEIRQDIAENSAIFDEKDVYEIRISKKSKEQYHPFYYRHNFAIRVLRLANFITDSKGILELTDKGISIDIKKFDPYADARIYEISSSHNITKNSNIALNITESWKDELLSSLLKLSPQDFEIFTRGLLKKMGITLDEEIGMKFVADGGLDGFGYLRSNTFRTTRVSLQAKRWQGKVSAPEIDKFRGAMDKHNSEYGIFITTSLFTRDAIKASRIGTRVITLINGDELCDLIAKYEYHVEPVITYTLDDFLS
ncbi:restriction endonuclease [Ligilactobacillus murinus]|jgi:restriction system protein|uniref:Mrr restriction system protein n=1 Tax=Ligilactobacillus murinus TaxID=1622 RepID=A0AAE6WI67_9LACO|nr:restriction endonuclease [Ligilactobacillus murinus]NEF81916.1 Mrr restriction system protein [Ligilactobacillus murinus]NEF84240.1 Mrr restriction system protein [Ligilactobacillus murinus]NEF86560.1 Mrr restriction system protein [Ligilactobacillus murinus]NEF88857.1 Mrr restriction system protein [Ligilactobacillus murinus]NEF91125.1 Mrr restriction system protein [Ligilactobacillus murinus]